MAVADTVTEVELEVSCPIGDDGIEVRVLYSPVTHHGLERRVVSAYEGTVVVPPAKVAEGMRRQLERLVEALTEAVAPLPEIELGGSTMQSRLALRWINLEWRGEIPVIVVDFNLASGGGYRGTDYVTADRLTDGTIRLIENLRPSFEQLAWNDLHERISGVIPVETTKRKVLVSYRSGRDKFAEAVAHKLGREGFLPWFDRWEVQAGDSIPGEIGDGFREVYGVILVLTPDYPDGKWARQELETAITKRVEENIRVVPIKYEPCDVPELLRPLRYIDCTDHTDDQFERQFKDIIDALNEIELNPYR